MANSFGSDLSFSRGVRETTDMETLKRMIPGCVSVEKTGEDLDRLHIDYVANLRRGAVIHIDGKTRRPGASRFWKQYVRGRQGIPNTEPDLAIETWSVKPTPALDGRAGWTFDESSDTDLILYSFDASDTNDVVLLSFQLLRMAARQNLCEWAARFGLTKQRTIDPKTGELRWESECMLVPANVVQSAIRSIERGGAAPSVTVGSPGPVLPGLAVDLAEPRHPREDFSNLVNEIPWGGMRPALVRKD